MYIYMCAWFYLFLDWSTFCPHFIVFMFICLFTFSIDFFFQVTGVLSIVSLVAFPFQKVCENCHVMDVIISPTCGVHCNLSFKINSSISFLFFCGSIATNDEPMLLTIEGKWFETIMHIMTKFRFLYVFHPKQVQLFISVDIHDKYWLSLTFALIGFQEGIRQCIPQVKTNLKDKGLVAPLAIIMSNVTWNTKLDFDESMAIYRQKPF